MCWKFDLRSSNWSQGTYLFTQTVSAHCHARRCWMGSDIPATSTTTTTMSSILSPIPVSPSALLHSRPVRKSSIRTTVSAARSALTVLSRSPLLHDLTQLFIISYSPASRILPWHLRRSTTNTSCPTCHELRHNIYRILISFSAVACKSISVNSSPRLRCMWLWYLPPRST